MGEMSLSIDQQRKLQCFKENCMYYDQHCITFKGYECIKLGGTKIPCQRSLGHNHGYPTQNPLSMRPRFVGESDGWVMDEGR